MPAIIADRKKSSDMLLVALMNAVLGWSIIGWLVALYWALNSEHRVRRIREVRAYATVEAIVTRSHARDARRRM